MKIKDQTQQQMNLAHREMNIITLMTTKYGNHRKEKSSPDSFKDGAGPFDMILTHLKK